MTQIQLPPQWETSPLSEIVEIIRGITYKKAQSATSPEEGLLPVLRANNIQKGKIFTSELVYVPKDLIRIHQKLIAGDIVVAMSSGSKSVVGKTAYVKRGFDGSFGAFCGVLRTAPECSANYVSWFTHSLDYRNRISSLSAGANINNLKPSHFDEIAVPIAPIAEQKAIVDKLDNLLAQVENTKARLERIPQILKRFRQSVLAAAVSGRLTDDEEVGDESWSPTKLANLCTAAFDGPFGSKLKSSDYIDGGVGVVRLENIRHLRFDQSKETFISEDKYLALIKNKLEKNDILFSSFVDEEVRACLFPFEASPFINKADCFCLRIDHKKALPEFVLYLLTSQVSYAQIKEHVQGVTRPRVNLKILKSLEFPVPPLQVQAEVVRKVEQLLARAERIEQQVNNALKRVNNFTQSILAKAFRGELTEQWRKDNPELVSGEKSAEALLGRIKSERAKQEPAVRRTKSKKSEHSAT